MGNNTTSNLDNLHDLQAVLDETAQDIAQVLPDIAQWPDAVLYFLKALEVKAKELDPKQQRDFENTLRYILAGSISIGRR